MSAIQIYGLFKQGSGSNFEEAPKPGMFDLKVSFQDSTKQAGSETDWYGTGQGEAQQMGRVQGPEAGGGSEEVR